jgi:dethiobiotin synthetase
MLARASGVTDPESDMNPVFLALEASPLAAGRMLNADVRLEDVFSAFRRLTGKHEFMVVEGIGGVMVPIKSGYFVIDMIKEMKLPALIVCRASLGTLNHALLTVRACKEYNLEIAGIVVNGVRDDNLIEKMVGDLVNEITKIFVIGSIPYVENIDQEDVIELVSKHVKYDLLIT